MPELTLEEARAAMIAKRFGGNVNGAKTADGTRRKKKAVHKSAGGSFLPHLQTIQVIFVNFKILYT